MGKDKIEEIWPQWKIVELLGRGTFGEVYKVRREDFGNEFFSAVKIINIPPDKSAVTELQSAGMDQMSIREYFYEKTSDLINEIKIMESLKSAQNIVSIEDYHYVEHKEEIGWTIYIRMELLTSLTKYIAEHGQLEQEEVLKLGIDMCAALSNCERRQIIHRDIKPSNIFINEFGDYKIGDFGEAKQLEKTQGAMSQKGTSMYMAPEIFRMEKYDKTVDIYALGIVLYRLLNGGRYPFVPENAKPDDMDRATRDRLMGKKMPAPYQAEERLADIIRKACAFESKERYQSAGELRRDLEDCLKNTKEKVSEGEKSAREIGEKTESVEKPSDRQFEKLDEDEDTIYIFSDQKRKNGIDLHKNEIIKESLAKSGGTIEVEANGKKQEVIIPPRTTNGQKIRCKGLGIQGEDGGEYGDLYIDIQIEPDQKEQNGLGKEETGFRTERYVLGESEKERIPNTEKKPVRGRDIHTDLAINKKLAEVGGKTQVQVNGEKIDVVIPAKCKDGHTVFIKGFGEEGKNGGEKGNLYVIIQVIAEDEKKTKGAGWIVTVYCFFAIVLFFRTFDNIKWIKMALEDPSMYNRNYMLWKSINELITEIMFIFGSIISNFYSKAYAFVRYGTMNEKKENTQRLKVMGILLIIITIGVLCLIFIEECYLPMAIMHVFMGMSIPCMIMLLIFGIVLVKMIIDMRKMLKNNYF